LRKTVRQLQQFLPCKLIKDEAPRKQIQSVMEAETKLHIMTSNVVRMTTRKLDYTLFNMSEASPSDSLAQTDERLSLEEKNAKNQCSPLESKRDSLYAEKR